MKTFHYWPTQTSTLAATDLKEEAEGMHNVEAYGITIYNEDGSPVAERAEALYADGRLGIAWGADATWADVRDLESGIEMWLNDGDAWTAAN